MIVKDDYLASVLAGTEKLLFDGGMGTMLQQRGFSTSNSPDLLCVTNASDVTAIHRAYVEAGSQAVTTNTFGANRRNLGDGARVEEVYAAAVSCARNAGARYVAGDIGPIGVMVEPLGDITFEEANELFAEQARAAQKAGADLIIVETMFDLNEMRAAVSAVKEETDLPLFATMTFGAQGCTFAGVSAKQAVEALTEWGVDALGVNCSLGPDGLQPIVFEMLELSSLPVIVQANAGLPEIVDGKPTYLMQPGDYAQAVAPMIEAGATIVGGCCGTTPEFIAQLAKLI